MLFHEWSCNPKLMMSRTLVASSNAGPLTASDIFVWLFSRSWQESVKSIEPWRWRWTCWWMFVVGLSRRECDRWHHGNLRSPFPFLFRWSSSFPNDTIPLNCHFSLCPFWAWPSFWLFSDCLFASVAIFGVLACAETINKNRDLDYFPCARWSQSYTSFELVTF